MNPLGSRPVGKSLRDLDVKVFVAHHVATRYLLFALVFCTRGQLNSKGMCLPIFEEQGKVRIYRRPSNVLERRLEAPRLNWGTRGAWR